LDVAPGVGQPARNGLYCTQGGNIHSTPNSHQNCRKVLQSPHFRI